MCTAALVFGALMMVRRPWALVPDTACWSYAPRGTAHAGCTYLSLMLLTSSPAPCPQYERRQHISGEFRGLFQAIEGEPASRVGDLRAGWAPVFCASSSCIMRCPDAMNCWSIGRRWGATVPVELLHCMTEPTTQTCLPPLSLSTPFRLLHRLLCVCVHPGAGRPHRHCCQPRPRHGATRGARPAAHRG